MKDSGLKRVTFMQGDLGHPTAKPTTVPTNMEKVEEIPRKCGSGDRHRGKEWPETVEDRLQMSKQLASWAPGMVEAIIHDICEQVGIEQRNPGIKALSRRQQLDADGWERHCRAGHIPHRRDCAVCLEGAGRDRPHHRQSCPDSYCLAVDMTGPFIPALDQEIKHPRYMLVGTTTIPVDAGGPLPDGLRSLCPQVPEAMEGEYEPSWMGEEQSGEDPWRGEQLEDDQPLTVAENEANAAWEKFLVGSQKRTVRTLTFAVPVKSRQAGDVVEAVARIYSRLRALQVPVLRVHSDRARELTSRPFKQWVANRSLYQTFSAGDEPQGTGRTERAIGLLKSRAKVLIKAAGVGDDHLAEAS